MTPRRRYYFDPVAILGALVLGALALSRAPAVLAGGLAPSMDYLTRIAVHAATVAVILLRLGRVPDAEERKYWRRVAGAFVVWLGIDMIRPDAAAIGMQLAVKLLEDLAFVAFYMQIASAAEMRAHEGPRGAIGASAYRVRIGSLAVVAAVLYGYFCAIPAWLAPARYNTLAPSCFLFAVLDAFVLTRFAMLSRAARAPRWKRTYAGMTLVAALWFAGDLLAGLYLSRLLPDISAGAFDALHFIPFFVVMALALLRDRDVRNGISRPPNLVRTSWASGVIPLLAAWSIALPGVHVAVSTAGLGGAEEVRARGILVLLAATGFVLVVLFRRRNVRARGDVLVSTENMEQAQRMEALGRLAGGVAHDFSNLLTAIRGYADLGAESAREKESAELFGQIRTATVRGQDLTTQLLAFSRNQQTDRQNIAINDAVLQSREMFVRLIGENIVMITELDPAAGYFSGVRGEFTQVLLNLVVNARDAMPAGGTLTIRTANVTMDPQSEGGGADGLGSLEYVMLEVEDDGEGMDATTSERAFEPFFTTRREVGGTGLGLATVYGIVRRNGGLVHIDSHPGRGTVFHVFFPRVFPVEDGTAPPAVSAEHGEGSETVLVVEDEGAVREITRRFLAGQGYRVIEAADGREATRIVDEFHGPIDVLLTDILMPNMGGWDFAEEFVRRHPGAPVVYMSGYADRRSAHTEVPGRVFLQKPFSLTDLARTVRRALDARSVE